MDLQSLVGGALLKQNQFVFDREEHDRNMRAMENARDTWARRIERFRQIVGRLRPVHHGLPTTTPAD